MVQPTTAAPAAAAARMVPPARLRSSGSFHAGAPIPSLTPYDIGEPTPRRSSAGRRQSSHRYHTFPTPPPKTPSDVPPPSFPEEGSGSDDGDDEISPSDGEDEQGRQRGEATPLPIKQLGLLALLSLCEQTALNSISPYLPAMVASFDEIPPTQAGLYVGLLASAFALAQLATNLLWGYLSDTVGRKPVMLLGTSLLAICFAFFGFCTRYWQLLLVHVGMGLLNGNAAVVPTVLGEVTDRTNQSRAFTWLPVMYSIGGITGPALGGLLVAGEDRAYPFLAPNIMSAALLCAAVIVLGIWFDETLEGIDAEEEGIGMVWARRVLEFLHLRRKKQGRKGSWSSRWPTRSRPSANGDAGDDGFDDDGEDQALLHDSHTNNEADSQDPEDSKSEQRKSAFRQLANRTTLTILITYLIFQLANISFNSLYPIFASAPPPAGRDLGPDTIGVSLSFAGLLTILFQVFVFEPLKARVGNLGTFRLSLLGLCISMALMPWVGYRDSAPLFGVGSGKLWLYIELGVVLVVKNLSAVGGLSCVLLLITNSAPSHETLGTLNGIAQTLSAAGRSVGPFLSGGLFTLSERIQPKGELLAWGLFGGIALIGWLGTLAIRGDKLESGDFVGDQQEGGDTDDDDDDEQSIGR